MSFGKKDRSEEGSGLQAEKDQEKSRVAIYPLSPNDRLDEGVSEEGEYSIYEEYLDEVFLHPELHNIAVTGNYGVGKSSLIRTFDRKRNQRRLDNRRFLYISLTNFHSNGSQDKGGEDQERSLKKKLEELERDLLCQVLYVCDDIRKVPGVTYRLIPSPKSWIGRQLPVFMLMLLAVSLFSLAYGSQLYAGVESYLPVKAVAWQRVHPHTLAAIPYGAILLCILFFVRKVAMWLFGGSYLSKLTLEGASKVAGVDKIGVDIQSVEGTSYLDRHGFELIYVLERMASRFDHTVVFEDMDRLGPDVQRELFSELREINCLANSRLSHKRGGVFHCLGGIFPGLGKLPVVGGLFRKPCLRFFYVAHDMEFTPMECSKFFDYILPVIPAISGESLPDRLAETYLKNVGIWLDERSNDTHQRPSVFLACAAPELNDYRTIHTILNEYQIFERIEKQRGLVITQKDKRDLFAYVTYKNLCPEDYYGIHTGKSLAFPAKPRQGSETFNQFRSSLVQDWLRNGFLPWDCILFAGYSLSWLRETYEEVLRSEDADRKRSLMWSCVDGRSRQRFLCANILLDMVEEAEFYRAIKGIQLSLVRYLLQIVPVEAKNSEIAEFDGKFQRLLKRAKYYDIFSDTSPEDPPEKPPEELKDLIRLRFWVLSTESQIMLFHYLFYFGYDMDGVEQWLFDKDMSSNSATEVWDLLHRLFRPELTALLRGKETAAFEWMVTPNILSCLDQSIQDEIMLRIVGQIASKEGPLPSEIGEINFEFRPGEQKTMQEWLDEVQETTAGVENQS